MLPVEFYPRTEASLTRIGSAFDGGYVVAIESLRPTRTLLSFGLGLDWTFEKDFRARTGAKVVAFDHTITRRSWQWGIFWSVVDVVLLRADPQTPISRFRHYKRYKEFFSGEDVIHRQEKIGPGFVGGTDIDALLKEHRPSTGVFFKIDIEGGEYRLLDQLVRHQESISGLVIEFHDCDLHRERIVDFIRAFDLRLVHIHGNNCGGCDDNGDPLVIEMTFKRGSPSDAPRTKPKEYPVDDLDRLNSPFMKDLVLNFASTSSKN